MLIEVNFSKYKLWYSFSEKKSIYIETSSTLFSARKLSLLFNKVKERRRKKRYVPNSKICGRIVVGSNITPIYDTSQHF